MRRILIVICSLILIITLVGCGNASLLLDNEGTDFINDLKDYELGYGEIPKSVLDTLDFMLENYTNGISQPSLNDINKNKIKDNDKDKIGNKATKDTTTRDEVREIILKALSETQPSVAFKVKSDLFSDKLFYEIIFEEIGGNYIIEALGVNSYSYSYYEDTTTKEYVVEITFNYFSLPNHDHKFTLDQIKQMKQELQQEAERVVNELNLNSLTEYEKVEAVNKYLCKKVTYSAGKSPYLPMQHTPYGALINGDSVCEGYAKAVQLLLKMCNVETYYVTGDTPGGPHGWNLVKVDGNYYQLDVTWNDVDSCPNQYFLVTDDYMTLSRTWDKAKFPPSAKTPYKK